MSGRGHVPGASRRVAMLLLAMAMPAAAQDAWTLTTSDFKSEAVTPRAIDQTAVTVAAADGGSRSVPTASFVQMTKSSSRKPPAGLVLCVAGGERLVGTPRRIDGANLVWFTVGVGEVTVPIEGCLGVLRDRTAADGLAETRSDDLVRLTTGDSVRGILTEASDAAFTFTPASGDPVKVAPAAVASILFAAPPGGRPAAPTPAYLVRVNGASVIAATALTLNGGELTVSTLAGPAVVLAWPMVESIEHTGGPVAWLSARVPTESVHTPYLDGRFPARMDGTVTGGPIRFGGVTYARGIGVHSRSRLTFALRPGDATFRTRYAIDGNLPAANVDVAVSLDGKRVHEQAGVRAGTLSPLIEIKLGDAKTLTLEVDYGQGYDVQDRLNWIEPAFVRDQ